MLSQKARKTSAWSALAGFVTAGAAALALASCANTPSVLILSNPADEGSSGPLSMGGVNLLTNRDVVLTVKNTRGDRATLTGFSEAGIGLGGVFKLNGGTCANGMVLVEDQSCTVVVRFQPEAEGPAQVTLTLQYFEGNDTNRVERTTKLVSGTGILDCTVRTELTQARAAGVTEAAARNQTEYNSGVAAGRALTYADGTRTGNANGYRVGYDQGYNSPQGYRAGYDNGYQTGFVQGSSSQAACDNGVAAGRSQASSDGSRQGQYDGYRAGYADGYAVGADDGYVDGYDAGVASCGPPRDLVPGPTPANLIEACHRQGFVATYSSASYTNGYNTAAAANSEYQRGLRDGYSAGLNAGTVVGIREGYAAGQNAGRPVGYNDGAQATYQRCYTQVYTPAYTTYYRASYEASYRPGAETGYTDGYNEYYDRGYVDGRHDTCPGAGASTPPQHRPRQYGQNQFWFVRVNGQWVEQFAVAANPVALSGQELTQFTGDLELARAGLSEFRNQAKADFRSESHAELKAQR